MAKDDVARMLALSAMSGAGGGSGGGGSDFLVIPIIPGVGDTPTFTTTTTCGEFKAAVDAGKVVIMAGQDTRKVAGTYPMLAQTLAKNFPDYSYTVYEATAEFMEGTITVMNKGEGSAEIPDADPCAVHFTGGGHS